MPRPRLCISSRRFVAAMSAGRWDISSSDGEQVPGGGAAARVAAGVLPETGRRELPQQEQPSSSTALIESTKKRPRGRPPRPRGRPPHKALKNSAARAAEEQIPGHADLARFLRPGMGGDLQSALTQGFLHAPRRVLPDIATVLSACLGANPRRIGTKNLEADLAGMTIYKWTHRVQDLAATIHLAAKTCTTSMLSHLGFGIDQGRLRPVASVSHLCFDETPMCVGAHLEATGDAAARAADNKGARASQVFKTWQAEATVGFLFHVVSQGDTAAPVAAGDFHGVPEGDTAARAAAGVHGDARGGQPLFLQIMLDPVLQALDSVTGETSKAAIDKIWDIPLMQAVRAKFPRNIDVRTADRASANLRADAGLQAEKSSHWHLLISCNAHIAHTCQGRSYKPLDKTLSGLIAYALAQKPGGAIRKLREQLACVLRLSVRVLPGPAPRPQDPRCVHRDLILQACISGQTFAAARRRVHLQELLHGDLTSDTVEVPTSGGASCRRAGRGGLGYASEPVVAAVGDTDLPTASLGEQLGQCRGDLAVG